MNVGGQEWFVDNLLILNPEDVAKKVIRQCKLGEVAIFVHLTSF